MLSRATFFVLLALLLAPSLADAADSFNKIELGQTFDTSGWRKASDGSWVKSGSLSGVSGYWSVDLCGSKVHNVSYIAGVDGQSEADTVSSVFRSGLERAGWRMGQPKSGPSPLGEFFVWYVPFSKGSYTRILSIQGAGEDWKVSLITDNPASCR